MLNVRLAGNHQYWKLLFIWLSLVMSISNGFVRIKIHDTRDDYDFDMVNFTFLDGDVPRSTSYGGYISQLILFARVSSHVDDFNTP